MPRGADWTVHGPVRVGDAQVWALALAEPSATDHARVDALTSGWPVPPTEAERASCEDWGHAGARLSRLAGRSLLRHAAAQVLGCSPEGLRVETEGSGRPVLRASAGSGLASVGDLGVAGSIAHTGGLAVVAVAAGVVGVDVERLDRALRWERLAGRVFTEAGERADLEGRPACARAEALRERWVVLEAVAKASGVGLARTLGAAPVVRALAPGVWLVEESTCRWCVRVGRRWEVLLGVARPWSGETSGESDG